jgi:hypothetical protein
MDHKIQVSRQQNRNLGRRGQAFERPAQFRPPMCAHCGNRFIRPFSEIYGNGTTFYTRIQGLIFRHGYERTKRQSVLANNCSPPIRLPWSPAVLVLLLYLSTRWGATRFAGFSNMFELVGYYLGWTSLLLAIVPAVNNFGFYPQRMNAWTRKFFCPRCGGCTLLDR